MTVDFQTLLAAIVPAVISLGWLFTLKGKVDAHEHRITAAETKIEDMNSNVVGELAKLREEFAEFRGEMKAIIKLTTHKE